MAAEAAETVEFEETEDTEAREAESTEPDVVLEPVMRVTRSVPGVKENVYGVIRQDITEDELDG